MSGNFSPGPWHASEMRMDRKSWASLNGDHELTIVQAKWDGFSGDVIAAVWADDDHDELATAHLIAAAPDLYEALGAVLRAYGNEAEEAAAHRAAEAALAKARGEQS